MWRITLFVVLLLSIPLTAYSQYNLNVSVGSKAVQNADVTYEIVDADRIRVVVTDSSGPVGGLGVDDFEIRTELTEGRIYRVEPLLKTEKARVSLVLCIDNSSSMNDHKDFLKSTLDELVESFGPSVKIGSVFFTEVFRGHAADRRNVLPNIQIYDFTQDRDFLRETFERHLYEAGLTTRTYLHDELFAGIKMLERVQDPGERKFIILLSDGQDIGSQKDAEDIRALARENAEIVFYTIDYLQKTNPFLENLAIESQGRYFRARKAEDLGTIFQDITQDIVKVTGYLVTYDIPRAIVVGHVLAASSCLPVQEAGIFMYPTDHPAHTENLPTNQNGGFSSQIAFNYDWFVRASAPGYLPDSSILNIEKEAIYFADFRLSPAHFTMRGKVMDSGTAPIAEAQVVATELGTGEILYEGRTDSMGVYEFEARVGHDVLVTATKDGFTYGSIEQRSVDPELTVPDIQLGLTAEGFVSEFRFLFEFDSDRLDLSDVSTRAQLDGCVDFVQRELAKSPTRMVRLVGWTDSLGTAEYNLDLSERRARYVKSYLAKHAIPSERMVARGEGISYKYNNETEEGRALNRRTDVVFFDQHQAVSEKF